jgi:hypothetical protein
MPLNAFPENNTGRSGRRKMAGVARDRESQSACVSTGAAGTAAHRAQSRDGEGRRRAYDTAGPRRNGSINKTSSPFRRTAKFDGLQENNVVGIERLRWEMPAVVVPVPPGARLSNVTWMPQWNR